MRRSRHSPRCRPPRPGCPLRVGVRMRVSGPGERRHACRGMRILCGLTEGNSRVRAAEVLGGRRIRQPAAG